MNLRGSYMCPRQLNADVAISGGAGVLFGSISHEKGKAMIKIQPNVNVVY